MAARDAAHAGHRVSSNQIAPKANFRLAVSGLLLLALFATGGASRSDEALQILPPVAAIIVLVATIWPLQAPRTLSPRWIWMAVAIYAVVSFQLLPLPPSLWASLPGHGIYARIAQEAGAVAWRPSSLTPSLTLNALFALLPATAAGLAALYLDFPTRTRLWGLIAAGAIISALLGMTQLALGGDSMRFYLETTPDSPVGIFANRNHQAVFLAGCLPFVGALAGASIAQRRSIGVALFASAAVLVLVLGIVLTSSRSGLLMGVGGLAGAVYSLHTQGVRVVPGGGRLRLALAGGVAGALVLISLFAAHSGVIERLLQTDPVSETRAQMIVPLLHTGWAYLPFGSGFGSFSSVYPQFEPDSLLSTIYMNQAHDELLQIAIEGGVPALLLAAVFIWWWTGAAVRLLRSELPARRRGVAIAALTFTAIMLAESLVDYPLRTPLLGALFVVACLEIARADSYRAKAI